MFNLNKFVRPNILSLTPYRSAREEFKGSAGIFLDANENPFGELNRYPDPSQMELKQALSHHRHIPCENICIGNGSDEMIDLAIRIFCNPAIDNMIICPPTYGLYEVMANVNDVGIIKIPLTNKFQLDIDRILKTPARIIFLCSPNNPTGNSLVNLDSLLQSFDGLVFLDEAYIDFSDQESLIHSLNLYPNLIISHTFSKAWGLAAARVGVMYASKEIISLFNKVKPPYNVSGPNQMAALQALKNLDMFSENVAAIRSQRKNVEKELSQLSIVLHTYPSDANFLLVEVNNADKIYAHLVKRNIITRNRSTEVKNCLRITVGSPPENKILMDELKLLSA